MQSGQVRGVQVSTDASEGTWFTASSARVGGGAPGTSDRDDRDRGVAAQVARAKTGDRQAIHFLYVTFSASVLRYVRGIVGDAHEAEDITQQVFAKLITVIHRYEERGLPFAAWILRVARNVALDHIRSSRTVPYEEMDGVPGPDHGLPESQHARRQCLKDALACLPDDQAKVVWLRHVAGLSPPEIAERLGRSESSIHGLHHRGRGALREALTVLGSGPSTASSGRPVAVRDAA